MKRVDRHHVVNLVDAKTVAADGSYTSSRGLTPQSFALIREATLDHPSQHSRSGEVRIGEERLESWISILLRDRMGEGDYLYPSL
jgi:hypothetical protein